MRNNRPSPDPRSGSMRKHPNAPDFDNFSRRGFLGVAAGGAALAYSAAHAAAQDAPEPLEQVSTTFFDPEEWITVIALCDVLIPAGGDGPGALESRVPVFLDRLLAGFWGAAERWYMEGPHVPDADPNQGFQSPLTPVGIYRGGIAHFDGWCGRTHGGAFKSLDAQKRHAAVDALMNKKIDLPAELRDFPDFLLLNVKQGYLSDPRHGGNYGMLAWSYIGFPGARGHFLAWTNPDRDAVPYPLGPVSISGERA